MMREHNTEEIKEFIIWQIYWILISIGVYKQSIFRCLEGFSFKESKMILWGLAIVSSIIGITLEIKKRRNGISHIVNLVIPIGIYTALVYFNIIRTRIMTVLAISFALSVIYTIFVMVQKIKSKSKRKRKKIILKRMKRCAVMTSYVMTCGFAVLMISLGIRIFFYSSIMQASISPQNDESSAWGLIEKKQDKLVLLQEEEWKKLSVQERLDVLQIIADIEQRFLGIPHELNVGASNLQGTLYGYYNDNTHEIIINVDIVLNNDLWDCVDTICHEAYHSYQHSCVDLYSYVDEKYKNLYIFDKTKSYVEEFEDYANSFQDFELYYHQECESDARDYAESSTDYYYTIVSEFLEKQE